MGLKVTFMFQNFCLQTLQSNVRVLVTTKSKQSSAYWIMRASSVICPVRSLTYRLKSSGPKIVPWGTPCFSSIQSDLTPFNETCLQSITEETFYKADDRR